MAPQTAAESESGVQPSGIKLPQLPLRELGFERRDGRGEHYHAIPRQQSRDETYATDIRFAVFS